MLTHIWCPYITHHCLTTPPSRTELAFITAHAIPLPWNSNSAHCAQYCMLYLPYALRVSCTATNSLQCRYCTVCQSHKRAPSKLVSSCRQQSCSICLAAKLQLEHQPPKCQWTATTWNGRPVVARQPVLSNTQVLQTYKLLLPKTAGQQTWL